MTARPKRLDVIELAGEPIRKSNSMLRAIGAPPVRFKTLAR